MGDLKLEEIAQRVIAGELSQQAAADLLGIPRTTFAFRMTKAYPDRPRGVNVRKENRKPVKGRPKKLSYLEYAYTDKTLCADLKCTRCPMRNEQGKCTGPDGLIKAMIKRRYPTHD